MAKSHTRGKAPPKQALQRPQTTAHFPTVNNVDLDERLDATEIFCDGLLEIMGGNFTSRLSFYRTIRLAPDAHGNLRDKREVVLRLVLPASAVVELCQTLAQALTQNPDVVRAGFDQYMKSIEGIQTNLPEGQANTPEAGSEDGAEA